MPTYNYIAKSSEGKKKKGQRRANSKRDLAQLLRQEGYFLISAEAKEKGKKKGALSLSSKRVPLTEKLMATRNLQVMISAGVALPRALEILSLQTKSKYFKKVLAETKEQILKGVSLSSAFANYPKVFPEIYCGMLRVGEKTGKLEEIFGILALQIERSYKLRSKVRGAMVYPLVIVGAMLLIGTIMLIKVVPQLSETFTELKIELPAMTRFIIALGNFSVERWYLLILFLLGFPFLLVTLSRTRQGKMYLDKILLKLPFFANLVKKINCAHTSLTLSALIKGGVPIVTSLGITVDAVGNFYFKQALRESVEKVKKGDKLSETIASFKGLYPPLFIQMLRVGEETGETSEMLSKLADFFEEQVDNITKNLSSIIEPILLLMIGGIVGFFAIAMVQPIYSIMGGV